MLRLNVALLLSLATLCAPVFGQGASPARPGTLNYVEGQASLEGRQLSPRAIGHAELHPGEFLATANGKAEILLTPGVFLRLGNDSTVKMIAPDLTHTEVQLTRGRASVEADQLYPQNDILINLNNGQVQLLKNGLYEFDASNGTVRVFDGKAAVYKTIAPQANEKPIDVKSGKQLTLANASIKPISFDRKRSEDDLYNWSSLRSEYLGEDNIDLAYQYAGAPGFAPGWFWDSAAYDYTWLPGDGLFWSPFGYGFYSPYYIYGGGYIYGGYHGGYGGRPGYPNRGGIARGSVTSSHSAGNFGGGGFHGSAVGGGFHGGGGGGGHR
ncbi:FecR domain-containing protein [Granulicella arctica]|uniref:Putative membrane protein YgcG n=1 Tax=Granulicella arctica TaxID=940613 RepID=A0A7Y9PIL4_9BACT|nr:FecR domain-containing protein [Granulicella arctica]NYF80507.1 putative membrane protein YgcG [Granulicella arctica]